MTSITHPFISERRMGAVHKVDGHSVEVTLPSAASVVGSTYGQRVPRGDVGEFVVIDIGGLGVFGRLLEIEGNQSDMNAESLSSFDTEVRATGYVQLLATVSLDGSYMRGIKRHPRIGDFVYSASDDVLKSIVSGVGSSAAASSELMIELGVLSTGDHVPVSLGASTLFGRHLAVLGATGGGKSWTVAHLLEEIASNNGRAILIDATGEFRSLGNIAEHVSLGLSPTGDTDGENVSLPHYQFSDSDRNAFFRPSGGSQLPKLRAAIHSLRLAHALGAESPIINEQGVIVKANRPRSEIIGPERHHAAIVESSTSEFSLRALPLQIPQECVYEHDLKNDKLYGGFSMNDIGYCNTLIARVMDLLQTQSILDIVDPAEQVPSVLERIDAWLGAADSKAILRISLKDVVFSHYLREIVVNTIGRRLLDKARQGHFLGEPVVVAIDEAHQFFGKTIGDEFTAATLDSFDSIAKEGRKYGLTVCMATQRPADIPVGVLSQAGMLIVHRLADRRDRERVEQASSELDQSATKVLPSLVPGEALLVGADFPVPLPVKMTRPLHKPSSSGPNYKRWSLRNRPSPE